MTPTPVPGIALADATSALVALGVFPVLALGAVLYIAGKAYSKFRK